MEEDYKEYYTNILKQFKNFTEDETEVLVKYLAGDNLTQKEIKELEKIYLKNMWKQKKDIDEKIETSKIRGLISCVSFSYNETLEKYKENTYDRNLNIFTELDTFFLLYTKET